MQLVSANPGAFFQMTASLGDIADQYWQRKRAEQAGDVRAKAAETWFGPEGARQQQPMATLGNLGAGVGAPPAPVLGAASPTAAGTTFPMAVGKDAFQPARGGGTGYGALNTIYQGALDKSAPDMPSPTTMYSYLRSQGASPNEAMLLTGAAASESGFNFRASHDGGTGYGLFGHRLDRLDKMRQFAGSDAPSWQQQAAFGLQELRSRPEAALVAKAQSPQDLAVAQMHFEQPQGYSRANPMGGHNFNGRLNTISRFSQAFGGDGGQPVRLAQAGASDAPLPVPAGQFLAQRQATMDAQQAGVGQVGLPGVAGGAPNPVAQTAAKVDAIKMLLRNPETQALGQQMWQALAQPKTSPFDFQVVGDSLVRVNKMTGEAVQVPGMGKTPSPVTLSEGATLVDPRTGAVIARGGEKDDRTTTQKDYEAAKAQGFNGTLFDYQTAVKKSGATNVSVETKGEQSFAQENGKALAKMFAAHAEEGAKAADNLNQLEQLRALGDQIGTGGGAALQAWAADKGIKLGPNAGKIEAYGAIIDRMTPQQRVPGAGATSDFDAKLMKSSLPRLMNTPGGNALIIDNLTTLQQNSMKRADVAMRVQAGELTAQQGILAMRELAKEASGINQTIRDAAMGRTPLPAPRQPAPRNPAAGVRVSTPEEARRLPKGTRIILPDGTPGVVP